MKRAAPPFTFMFLHTSLAWPAGVVSLALGSGLVRAGVSVQRASHVIALSSLAFTLEFVWAPLVDGSLSRRTWFVLGALAMCGCLAFLLVAPWNAGEVPLLAGLAFASCSGAAICGVATKGIMAYDVPETRLGRASGFYTAGGVLAKAIGGGGTLWLVTHLASRSAAAAVSVGTAAAAGATVILASRGRARPLREVPARMLSALRELLGFLRTSLGLLVAIMCVLPFGAGTEAGLIGAISREWGVTPDQLAVFSALAAGASLVGATFAGWLSTRIGPWNAFVAQGWGMIGMMLLFAVAPRTSAVFLVVELFYRALATACYAALLAIVMTTIGKGAASTKAAVMWSLTNVAFFYPTLIDGAVHDHAGTAAMILGDAALAATGFLLILAARRRLGGSRSLARTPALVVSGAD